MTANLPTTVRRLEPVANDIVTEDSAATRFVEMNGPDIRFCHTSKDWFVWQGGVWREDQTQSVFHSIRELARDLSEDQNGRNRYITNKAAFAAAVERLAKADPAVAITIDQWDSEPMLIGTPGGTVDLLTGLLRPGRREDFITKATSVTPGTVPCSRWLSFLAETTGHDQEMIKFLQQWCGYILTGSTREHALMFVHGPGGNGKSVFLNIVTRILGAYATTAAMGTFTASRMDKHPTEIAMLKGARLVTASETEEGQSWAESRIKQMTGGDPLTARFMKQDFFTFTPQFKLMIVGNYTPVLQNVDDAMRRRFLIVPFERRPAEPDRELEQKLMSEAPSILHWMVEGCLDWQRDGLVKPGTVVAATEEYFSDQDLFGHWLDERCDIDPDVAESSRPLYASWKEYALAGSSQPGTTKSFKTKMDRHGFRHVRDRTGSQFHGVKVRPMLVRGQ